MIMEIPLVDSNTIIIFFLISLNLLLGFVMTSLFKIVVSGNSLTMPLSLVMFMSTF